MIKTKYRIFGVFVLAAILILTLSAPALAFDGRPGDVVEIKADEVVADDVYVAASRFTLDGTVQGDLVVFAETIIVNGKVEGDLIAAGQSVIVNGAVMDDARIAGAVLKLSETAFIGGDVVSAGASLETEKGSVVKGDVVVGAGQALLEGKIGDDALAGTGSLEINGEVGGDVKAEVGDPEEGAPPMSMFFPQAGVNFPTVKPGFNVGENAKIGGNLEYTQSKDVNIPSNAVAGTVVRNEPVVNPDEVEIPPTFAEQAVSWTLDLFRTIVTWIALGLLLGWLASPFMKALMEKIQSQPAASLGWGVIAYAAFFFVLLVILTVVILGGVLFGALTLGGLSGTVIWVGVLALFALILVFVLVSSFLTKIAAAWLSGKLILARVKPELAEHKFLPLAVGVILVALLVALPFVGWVFGLLITFAGLGALWLWGRDLWQARKSAAA